MTALRLSILGVSLLLASAVTAAPARKEAPATGFLFKTFEHKGRTLNYTVYVPRGYDASKPWPLILFLHGAGESGADGVRPMIQGIGSAIQWNPAEWPFIVLIPQKPDIREQWEQHEPTLMALLDQAKRDYRIDSDRIYLTGLSQGGHGAWIIGSRHPDVWAAIAPICGYASGGQRRAEQAPQELPPPFSGTLDDIAKPLKDVPVWAFHGEADPVVPVKETKDLVAAIEAAGGHPKITTYPGVDHNSWDNAYRNEHLGAWFLQHKRGEK